MSKKEVSPACFLLKDAASVGRLEGCVCVCVCGGYLKSTPYSTKLNDLVLAMATEIFTLYIPVVSEHERARVSIEITRIRLVL